MLVAVGINRAGHREVLEVMEGTKEDKESWAAFLRYLKERGLRGVLLLVADKCLGLVESLAEFYPDARWQRCAVHFYRNAFTVVAKGRVREVAAMLKAIHAQEDEAAAQADKLDILRLSKATALVRQSSGESSASLK